MRTMNKVLLIGNLTRDPEMTEHDSGTKMAKFTLATNRHWTGKDGEKKEKTDFHNVVAWRKLAEICHEHLRKGAAVLVEGKLNSNQYKDKEGTTKSVMEVQAEEVNFITYKKQNDIDQINIVTVDGEDE